MHMYTNIHAYIYIYTYMYTHTHTHIYIYILTYIYIHIHIQIDIHTYIHTYTYVHIYVHLWIHTYISSSSSCRAISTDILEPLSPPLPIVHRIRQVLRAWAGCPAFVRPCEGVYRSTSLMSSYQLLQQCFACLVRLTLIVFVMGVWWPYRSCFVGFCLQDLFNIARSILV